MAPIGDEEIRVSIVVIITRADSLTPAGESDARFLGYIREGAIVIVAIEVAGWFLALGESSESGTVYQENVRPAVIGIVKEGRAAASAFHDVFLEVFAAEDCPSREARAFGNINEIYFWRERRRRYLGGQFGAGGLHEWQQKCESAQRDDYKNG